TIDMGSQHKSGKQQEKNGSLKLYVQIYNVIQILLCSYMVYGLMPCISFPNIFGINSEFDAQGEWFVFVHYLSKFLDWFDTLWIILKKNRKQLSFLHVYHHMTIPMVWGYLLHNGVANGTTRYGAWVNSLTHVIMYSHYLWTSFGLRNPFKHLITGWQIAQFYSCLLHAFVVRALEETECWKMAWLQICYQV
ncbi:ELOVL5, partial [Symbiodinium pilosum]